MGIGAVNPNTTVVAGTERARVVRACAHVALCTALRRGARCVPVSLGINYFRRPSHLPQRAASSARTARARSTASMLEKGGGCRKHGAIRYCVHAIPCACTQEMWSPTCVTIPWLGSPRRRLVGPSRPAHCPIGAEQHNMIVRVAAERRQERDRRMRGRRGPEGACEACKPKTPPALIIRHWRAIRPPPLTGSRRREPPSTACRT